MGTSSSSLTSSDRRRRHLFSYFILTQRKEQCLRNLTTKRKKRPRLLAGLPRRPNSRRTPARAPSKKRRRCKLKRSQTRKRSLAGKGLSGRTTDKLLRLQCRVDTFTVKLRTNY